jgi:hypothetical protein
MDGSGFCINTAKGQKEQQHSTKGSFVIGQVLSVTCLLKNGTAQRLDILLKWITILILEESKINTLAPK